MTSLLMEFRDKPIIIIIIIVIYFHLWVIVSFWFQMTLEKHTLFFNVYL